MTPIIKFENVSKFYNDQAVVENLSLEINPGELFVLVGESGSGKTTSLKMVNRLIKPDSGEIFFKGVNVKEIDLQKLRLQIGYVLQQIALFPMMTVEQNIAVIPEMLGLSKVTTMNRTKSLLESVGLDEKEYRTRRPSELSGGEQQRVGIVRALSGYPEVIIMDEPFSALDPLSRVQLQDLVLQLHAKLGMTILFVTHDVNEALKLGDRIGVLRHGQVQQVDTPSEILKNPVNDFVADFFSGVHHIWLDNPLHDLADYGTIQQVNPDLVVNNRDVFSAKSPLRVILTALADDSEIKVLDKDQCFSLTQGQVWKFLAENAST